MYANRYSLLYGKFIFLHFMCPGDNAPQSAIDIAYALGKLIAQEGWILLSGGRKQGAMRAVNEGAKSANGLTVGIIPTRDNDNTLIPLIFQSLQIWVALATTLLFYQVMRIIADGMGPGTVSEAGLALKTKKHIICLVLMR